MLLCCMGGLLAGKRAEAFVLIGPMDPAELASGGVDFNYTDDLGGPKDLKRFSAGTFRFSLTRLTRASSNISGWKVAWRSRKRSRL